MVWLGCQNCLVMMLCLIQLALLMQLKRLLYRVRYVCPPHRGSWQLSLHAVLSFVKIGHVAKIFLWDSAGDEAKHCSGNLRTVSVERQDGRRSAEKRAPVCSSDKPPRQTMIARETLLDQRQRLNGLSAQSGGSREPRAAARPAART